MPIQLTTPVTISAYIGVSAETLQQVRVIAFEIDRVANEMRLTTQYGNTVGARWVPSRTLPTRIVTIANRAAIVAPGGTIPADPAYTDFVNAALVPVGGEGQRLFLLLETALHERLIATVPEFDGTVV